MPLSAEPWPEMQHLVHVRDLSSRDISLAIFKTLREQLVNTASLNVDKGHRSRQLGKRADLLTNSNLGGLALGETREILQPARNTQLCQQPASIYVSRWWASGCILDEILHVSVQGTQQGR